MGDKESTRSKKIRYNKTARSTRRRIIYLKRKQAKRKRFFISIITIFTLITLILAIGSGKSEAESYTYVTASSLWEIAKEHCPDSMDKRDYIAEVMKLNGMEDYTVYANRLYRVPVYE